MAEAAPKERAGNGPAGEHASSRPPDDPSKPTKLEILFTWAAQILAIALAVLFGVYSILSYYAAEQAVAQADTANQIARQARDDAQLANQLALLTFCQNQRVCFFSSLNERDADGPMICSMI